MLQLAPESSLNNDGQQKQACWRDASNSLALQWYVYTPASGRVIKPGCAMALWRNNQGIALSESHLAFAFVAWHHKR
ncbi:MAG: hypothetical protein AAGD07_19815 [Planctomycetota bacterium]